MRIETLEGWSSPLVRSVRRLTFNAAGRAPMAPDGCWDLVVMRWEGHVQVLRTGLSTRTVTYPHEAGEEMLALSFGPQTFMPAAPARRDAAAFLEVSGGRVRLGAELVEVPTWGNVDAFVERLGRGGIVRVDPVVASMVAGRPVAASERTRQRRFASATGLTHKAFTQVERARRAVDLLQAGQVAADVAYEVGYADQPHLTRSLKAIMGQTPGQVRRAEPVGQLQLPPLLVV